MAASDDFAAMKAHIEKLEQKLERLQRMEDVAAIQNIVSTMAYLYDAGMHEERMAYVARKTPGVTVEIGLRGVFEDYEGARRALVEVEQFFEHSHAMGMKKTFPEVEFPAELAGMLQSELLGTPVIEVAGDRQTAKAMWTSLMAVGKTHEQDPKPRASWLWWKTAIDFVREDDEWKIWHYLKNPMFFAAYEKDWVDASLELPPPPPPGTSKGITSHGGAPDRASTKLYDSYRITRVPRLIPEPPKPYDTFDPKDQYSY